MMVIGEPEDVDIKHDSIITSFDFYCLQMEIRQRHEAIAVSGAVQQAKSNGWLSRARTFWFVTLQGYFTCPVAALQKRRRNTFLKSKTTGLDS